MIANFLITALIIFGLFRALHIILKRVRAHKHSRFQTHRYLPFVEYALWFGYTLWVIKYIHDSNNDFIIVSLFIGIILLAVPLFFLIRDFAIGIFLKLDNKISEGKQVEIGSLKGTIYKAGHFRLDIEDCHGNISSISYSQIRRKTIKAGKNNQNLEKASIRFVFSNTDKSNALITKLKALVLSTPWVSASQLPFIESAEHKDGRLTITMGLYLLDKSYTENIASVIKPFLNAESISAV